MDIFTAYEIFKKTKSWMDDSGSHPFSKHKPLIIDNKSGLVNSRSFTFDLRKSTIPENEIKGLLDATKTYERKLNNQIPFFTHQEINEWVWSSTRFLQRKRIDLTSEINDVFNWSVVFFGRIQNICYQREKLNPMIGLFTDKEIHKHSLVYLKIAKKKKEYESRSWFS